MDGPAKTSFVPIRSGREAGHMVFMFNIFLPLLAGILAADRMQRDFRTGVRELQRSTPLSMPDVHPCQISGRADSPCLLPMFLLVLVTGAAGRGQGTCAAQSFCGRSCWLSCPLRFRRMPLWSPSRWPVRWSCLCACTRCCSPDTGSGATCSARRLFPPSATRC